VGRTLTTEGVATEQPESSGPPLVLRAIWFVLVGFWLSGLALLVAYGLLLTIVGLPLAFWIFDRVPFLLTLRGRSAPARRTAGAAQAPLWARAVYFVLVGWWLGALWLSAAYALMVTVIGIPVSVMMLNRIPEVVTLQRN
jgi:uncharacterized membrane protein YccF (DUF307 family)